MRRRRAPLRPQPPQSGGFNVPVVMPRAPRSGASTGAASSSGGGGGGDPPGPMDIVFAYANYSWPDFPAGAPVKGDDSFATEDSFGVDVGGGSQFSNAVLVVVRNAPAGSDVVFSVAFTPDGLGGDAAPEFRAYGGTLMMVFQLLLDTPYLFATGTYTIGATVDGADVGFVTFTVYEVG